MIGTKVVVGYDQNAVVKGLKGMTGLFGRTFKQIGIGAARQVGVGITNMLGSVVGMVPAAVKEFVTLNGEMYDLARAIDVPLDRLMVMREAFRLGGTDLQSVAKMWVTLGNNIQAATKGGPGMDAIEQLFGGSATTPKSGIVHDLVKLRLDKRLEAIGTAVSKWRGTKDELNERLTEIFGSKPAIKMIMVLSDWTSAMKQAENNMGPFARIMAASAGSIDDTADALGRLKNVQMEVAFMLAKSGSRIMGEGGGVNDFFNNIDKKILASEGQFDEWARTIQNLFKSISDRGISNSLKDMAKLLGEYIGEGIVNGVTKKLNPDKSGTSLLEKNVALANEMLPSGEGIFASAIRTIMTMGMTQDEKTAYALQRKETEKTNAILQKWAGGTTVFE